MPFKLNAFTRLLDAVTARFLFIFGMLAPFYAHILFSFSVEKEDD